MSRDRCPHCQRQSAGPSTNLCAVALRGMPCLTDERRREILAEELQAAAQSLQAAADELQKPEEEIDWFVVGGGVSVVGKRYSEQTAHFFS